MRLMLLTTQRQDSLDGSGIHIKLGLFVYEFIKSLSQIKKERRKQLGRGVCKVSTASIDSRNDDL